MSVLFIANPRSLNKGQGHLYALRQLNKKVYILVDTPPSEYELNVLPNFNNFLVADFADLSQVKSQIKDKDIELVIVLSENLLVLQNKIEKILGLNESMPVTSAEILSNKYLFDQFCSKNNISVPKHSLIKKIEDFDITYPCIPKSTIGTGQYYTIRDNDVFFEYRRFVNGKALLNYLEKNNLLEIFLSANINGLRIPRYGDSTLRFYTQEYIQSNDEYCTTGVIMNGVPHFYLTGQLFKYCEYDDIMTIDEMHSKGKQQHSTEHIAYIMSKPDSRILKHYQNFYKTLIDKLKIKTMFFSGPDTYSADTGDYFIDLNARLSGEFNVIYDRVAKKCVENTWRSLLYNTPLKDYELECSVATGYPLIMPGKYIQKAPLVNDNVDFLNFNSELNIAETRRNIGNRKLLEKVIVYGIDSDEVKRNFLTATDTILTAYEKSLFHPNQ